MQKVQILIFRRIFFYQNWPKIESCATKRSPIRRRVLYDIYKHFKGVHDGKIIYLHFGRNDFYKVGEISKLISMKMVEKRQLSKNGQKLEVGRCLTRFFGKNIKFYFSDFEIFNKNRTRGQMSKFWATILFF